MIKCEPCVNSLSENRKTELEQLFWNIVGVYNEYMYPIENNPKVKYDDEFLQYQNETRKNVDEAILKIIQENPELLLIRASNNKAYGLLWEYIMGNYEENTFLPKTMEFILKHPVASMLEDSLGYILPYSLTFCADANTLNLISENPQQRTWQLLGSGANVGMRLASDLVGQHGYIKPVNLEPVEKLLKQYDCSIQQDSSRNNIAMYCIRRASRALDYYEESKDKRYLDFSKKIQSMVLESMELFPETAIESTWNGQTTMQLYTSLYTRILDFESGIENKPIKEEPEITIKDSNLTNLIPTSDSLVKKLSLFKK